MTTVYVREGMTAAEIESQRSALKRALATLDVVQTNCAHCQHFEIGACALHGEVPLAFQKTTGQCDDWRADGVPW